MAGLAQVHRQVHQAGRDDATTGIDGLIGFEVAGNVVDRDDHALGNCDISRLIKTAGGVDDATTLDQNTHASFPATMLITAMRTAMP